MEEGTTMLLKRTALAPMVALLLGGCSMTLAVNGQVEGTEEVFTGSATGYMDGAGTVEITSAKTTCKGDFVYVTRREGKGTFRCADGRTGPFEFVSTGSRGTGTGDFAGKRFIFTFG
jgi:hypothetical protein